MYKLVNSDALEALKTLDNESIDCVATSPPYWNLRDYNHKEQLGSEKCFTTYLNRLWHIFDEVKRVLKPSGTCWVNISDTYAGKNYHSNSVSRNRH